MSLATGLDHVGVATADLAACAAAWEAIGFSLTPLAAHRDGAGKPTGTGNRCAMFRRGYVELITTIDPEKPSATLARFVARYEGVHIVTFATDDEQATLARLKRAGFETAISHSERVVEGGVARFARLPLSGDNLRLQVLRQLTPALMRADAHANRAVALAGVVAFDKRPAELAARLSRAAGGVLTPDPRGGYVLALEGARVRVLPPNAMPQIPKPALPCVAAIEVRTDDRTVAAQRFGRATADGVLAEAAGTAVLFV